MAEKLKKNYRCGIITFEKHQGRKDIGSSRIRGSWLVKNWEDAELFVQGQKYDAVIYQKAYYVDHAKVFKGVKIFDLCVSGDELIFSEKGWVFSKDISIGDKILTHNGTFERVNEIYKRKALTKNVKVSGLPNVRMTNNHPLLSCDYKYDIRKGKVYSKMNWKNVDDLRITGKVKDGNYYKGGSCATSLVKRNIKLNNLTDNEGWFWGYYSAEGSRNINGVSFAMHKNETEQKSKILEVIKDIYNKKGRYYNILDNVVRVDFNSRELSRFIKENIYSNDKKNIPSDVFNASKSVKLNFLEGYVSGDGYCNDYGGISVASVSKKLAYSTWQLLNDCGLNAKISYASRKGENCKFIHKDGKEYIGKPQWKVWLNPRDSLRFCRLTNIERFKKCKIDYWKTLKSKNTEVEKVGQYYARPVRQIENYKKEDVYNFNVENNHSYIVSGIITHNCDPDFLHWGYRTKEMIDECDAVTTSTEALAETLRSFTDKPVMCIPDRINLTEIPSNLRKNHIGEAKWVVWFGYSTNYEMLKPVVHFLKKFKLNLICISDKAFSITGRGDIELKNYTHNWDTIYRDILDGDIVVNPQSSRGRWKYKSNNKTLLSWALGMPVATNIDELKKFISEDARKEEQVIRNKELKEKWDVRLSVEAYKKLIQKLSSSKIET